MTFTLPALGFAVGSALFERPPVPGRRSASRATSRTTPTCRRSSPRSRASARSARPRSTCAPTTRRSTARRIPTSAGGGDFIAISTPLHAPRLPGALRRGLRALHLPVPRRRLRLHGQRLRRPAGAPARPLLHARAQTARSRSGRATRSTPSSSASRATAIPAQDARRHRPVPLPRPLLDAEAATDDDAPKLPDPEALPAAAEAARRGRGASSRSTRPRRPGSMPSTGSTSARRCPAACAG